MSTLYKRGNSPYWYASIGKYRFSTKTEQKTRALRVLKKTEQELWENSYELVDHSNRGPDEFFEKYLAWIGANKRYHTLRSYKTIIGTFRKYIQSRGVRRMRDMRQQLFEEYIMHRLRVSKRWTVNNHIIALKAMFNKAVEWHYIKKNPAARHHQVEVNDAKEIKAMSEKECRRFLDVCEREHFQQYPMFYAFLTTGMRAGELFSLEWTDVDFARKLIYIRNKPGFSPKGKDLRSNKGKERMIPASPGLLKLLDGMPRLSSYVFTDNGRSFSKQKPRRLLMKIAEKAEIQGLTRLHELRHTYASILLSKGIHIFALKELLGHSDIKDTQRYSHMIPEHFMSARLLVEKIDVMRV